MHRPEKYCYECGAGPLSAWYDKPICEDCIDVYNVSKTRAEKAVASLSSENEELKEKVALLTECAERRRRERDDAMRALDEHLQQDHEHPDRPIGGERFHPECLTNGCTNPAGTAWWCSQCNTARMDRITKNIKEFPGWDTGEWRNCFHFNPASHPDQNVEKKMSQIAKKNRRFDVMWGVVNPGNALCHAVFKTKREATRYKRDYASAYVVVKVIVTPLYTNYDGNRR